MKNPTKNTGGNSRGRDQRMNQNNNEFQNIREAVDSIQKVSKIISAKINYNKIPSKPADIIQMRDRLVSEEKLNDKADKARKEIKEILDKRKQADKALRKARRQKIKKIFGIKTKEANGQS